MIIVTGGAGFIGGNFILDWFGSGNAEGIVNVDKLTYAGNLATLRSLPADATHHFVKGDIGDKALWSDLLKKWRPRAVINFAAESHVDRSIIGPQAFIETNVVGTFTLLDACRSHWDSLPPSEKDSFRFIHVSTDEVYGSLVLNDPAFSEENRYEPNSPYAASKAASDHLVRAYFHTYGLPTITTNCSNNYGPFHFPEKLIPLTITNALSGREIPIYGDGLQVRDWLYVRDHCSAIRVVLEHGGPGETYNIGGANERTNLQVVNGICDLLDVIRSRPNGGSYRQQIVHVADRQGHDRRYAINSAKIRRELGWMPEESFDSGLKKTVSWFLENNEWVLGVTSGEYREWLSINYGEREKQCIRA